MDQSTWDALDKFKRWGSHSGWPPNVKRLWAPVDDVHSVMLKVVQSTQTSLHAAYFGWDDEEIDAAFRSKWADPNIRIKLALDRSQAAAKTEQLILTKWPARTLGSDLVIGHSELKGAFNHVKILQSDDCVCSGSLNLSQSAEQWQENELTLIWDAHVALEAMTRVSVIFDAMWAQPGAKDAIKLLGQDTGGTS